MKHEHETMNEETPIQSENETESGASSTPDNERELLRREVEDWRDKYLRKLAEFENYRKRTRGEMESVRDYATEAVLVSLLPVLDDFERMLADQNMPQDDPYRKGVELIRGKLAGVFAARGVVKIECLGKPFDPATCEALAVQPTPGFPAGTVMMVITPGYAIGERVIRHAQVIVSGEVENEQDSGKEDRAN
jgi:molecular chaperone GrpE